MAKSLTAMTVACACLLGCARSSSVPATPQGDSWQAPELPERQQELILARGVELMRESGHWQGYPLTSLGFDKERKQWKLMFSDNRPDAGYAVFIENENATQIDILLFPPMWTKYERTNTSNRTSGGMRQAADGLTKPSR